jgi:hypothetical protein
MTAKRRSGSTRVTHEGVDPLAGAHVEAGARRGRPREEAVTAAEAVDRLPAGAEPDLGAPMTDRQLDQRDRQQSGQRKKPGPKSPETPPAPPVAPAPSAPPPTDPE